MGLNFNASLTLPASSIEHAVSPSRYDISYYQSTLEAVQNINDKVTDLRISLYDIPNHEYVNEAAVLSTLFDKIIDMWNTVAFIVTDTSIRTKYIVNDAITYAMDQNPARIAWTDNGGIKSNIITDKNNLTSYAGIDRGYYPSMPVSTVNSNLYKMEFPHFKVLLFDDRSTFKDSDGNCIPHNIFESLDKVFSSNIDRDELNKLVSQLNRLSYRYISPCTRWEGLDGEYYDSFETYQEFIKKYYGSPFYTERVLITPDVLNMVIHNFDKYATILNDLKELEVYTVHSTANRMIELAQHVRHSIVNSAQSLDSYDMEYLIIVSSTVLNMVKNRCQSYLMDISIRCDVLRDCLYTDASVLDTISHVVNRKESTSVSISATKESSLEDYNISMFEFNEAYNLFRFQVALDSLNEDGNNTSTNATPAQNAPANNNSSSGKDSTSVNVKSGPKLSGNGGIDTILNNIKQMVQKWLMNANELFGIDKKWFNANQGALEDLGTDKRPFPHPEGQLNDWYNYDKTHRDILIKSNDIVFDSASEDLMNALESNDSFTAYIFNKVFHMQPDQNMKSASFQEKCKQAYSGGKSDKVKIGDVAKDKDGMLNYCKNYLSGDSGSIFKSIKKDVADMDKNRVQALKDLEAKKARITSNNNQSQNTNNNQQNQNNNSNNNNNAQSNSSNQSNNNSGEQQGAEIVRLADHIAQKNATTPQNNSAFTFDITNTLLSEANVDPNSIQKDNNATNQQPAGNNANGSNNNNNNSGNKDFTQLQTKINRFFTMMGNLLGARLTCSMQCYNQYKFVLKWALKNSTLSGSNSNNKDQKNNEQNKQENKPEEQKAKTTTKSSKKKK